MINFAMPSIWIQGIQYNFHYPFAIHKLQALKKFYKNEKYINSEKIANEGISIPIDPILNKNELSKIVRVLNNF